MTLPLLKRSVSIAGRKTSLRVERRIWGHILRIAGELGVDAGHLVARIERRSRGEDLSSSVRMFVVRDLERRAFPGVFVGQDGRPPSATPGG